MEGAGWNDAGKFTLAGSFHSTSCLLSFDKVYIAKPVKKVVRKKARAGSIASVSSSAAQAAAVRTSKRKRVASRRHSFVRTCWCLTRTPSCLPQTDNHQPTMSYPQDESSNSRASSRKSVSPVCSPAAPNTQHCTLTLTTRMPQSTRTLQGDKKPKAHRGRKRNDATATKSRKRGRSESIGGDATPTATATAGATTAEITPKVEPATPTPAAGAATTGSSVKDEELKSIVPHGGASSGRRKKAGKGEQSSGAGNTTRGRRSFKRPRCVCVCVLICRRGSHTCVPERKADFRFMCAHVCVGQATHGAGVAAACEAW